MDMPISSWWRGAYFPHDHVVLGEIHQVRAKRNHGGQSLERLAERGGLSPSEAVAIIEDIDWYACTYEHAVQVIGTKNQVDLRG